MVLFGKSLIFLKFSYLLLFSPRTNQGLNLDDCYAAYDQIERSQNNGPYQDVCNVLGDDIQLEKP